MNPRLKPAIIVFLLYPLFAAQGESAQPDSAPAAWHVGSRFRTQLNTVFPDVYWEGNPLRNAVTDLARSQRVAILIDRRIDPERRLTMELHNVSLERVFREVASRSNASVSLFGSVVYLGPPKTARILRTLAMQRRSEVQDPSSESGRRLLAAAKLGWQDLETPRRILEQLAKQSGTTIHGIETVPHDLWAGADLPPLSLIDRVTLIAVQFDLTFSIDREQGAVTLKPLPDDIAIRREYAAGRDPRAQAERWKKLAPEADVQITDGKIVVLATLEEHERLQNPPRATRPRTPPNRHTAAGEKRYTLTSKQGPLDRMLQQLTKTLGLELRMDREAMEAAGVSLSQNVAFSVKEGTIDDLFEALLTPVGADFRLEGTVVEVFPARSGEMKSPSPNR